MKKTALRILTCLALFTLCLSSRQAQAVVILGTLEGEVTFFVATDINGAYDTDSFQAILPFAVGSPVSAQFQYDTETGNIFFGGYQNLAGMIGVTIGDTTFGGTNNITVSVNDNTFGTGDRLIIGRSLPFADVQDVFFPADWTHQFDRQADGSTDSAVTSTGFRIGLFDTTDAVFQDELIPTGPFGTDDFTSLDFTIGTWIDTGGTSTWELPGGGSHTGRSQTISGSFSSVTISEVAVPEPSTAMLALLSTVGLLVVMSRTKRTTLVLLVFMSWTLMSIQDTTAYAEDISALLTVGPLSVQLSDLDLNDGIEPNFQWTQDAWTSEIERDASMSLNGVFQTGLSFSDPQRTEIVGDYRLQPAGVTSYVDNLGDFQGLEIFMTRDPGEEAEYSYGFAGINLEPSRRFFTATGTTPAIYSGSNYTFEITPNTAVIFSIEVDSELFSLARDVDDHGVSTQVEMAVGNLESVEPPNFEDPLGNPYMARVLDASSDDRDGTSRFNHSNRWFVDGEIRGVRESLTRRTMSVDYLNVSSSTASGYFYLEAFAHIQTAAVVVPEPSTAMLALLSTIGLFNIMSRAKRTMFVRQGCIVLAITAGSSALLPQDCEADFFVTAEEIGDDVVVTGSGDFTAWQWDADGFSFGSIDPGASGFFDGVSIGFGNAGDIASEVGSFFASIDSFIVPETLGLDISGTFASSFSGDPFGVGVSNYPAPDNATLILSAPRNYIAGTELNGVMTFDGASLESMGLVSGTYVFSWNVGAITDALTLEVASTVVPEPTTASLGLLALAGLCLRRKHSNIFATRG